MATMFAGARPRAHGPDADASITARLLGFAMLQAAVVALALAGVSEAYYAAWEAWLGKIVAAVATVGLSALPVLVSLVHATSRDRQLSKLETLATFPVAGTYYYRSAVNGVKGLRVATLGSGYLLPMMTLFCTVLLMAGALFLSPWFALFFAQKSFVLGGFAALGMASNEAVQAYQQATFLCGMAAFLGSYIYMLGRTWDRINNNDIYPTSYHYYTIRIVIAYVVAVVVRHSLALLGVEETGLVVPLGFVIGLTPDFFVLALARRAYQLVKVFGSKEDPLVENRPPSMPLLMLDDLSREKIDRLGELGIDSAQVLACQNPFLVWPRLPYDLGLMIDWIAQAQLYVLVRERGLKRLRDLCVYDVLDLHLRLDDAQARKEICAALGVSEEAAPVMVRQLDADQSFTRLKEVRDALRS